jgi:fatty acid desaturase
MSDKPTWNPLTEWRHTDIEWVRVKISRADLARFTKRSNTKGLFHSIGFLLLIGTTGALSYLAFSTGYWVLLALALYVHGTFYGFFGNALHELSHNTVFRSRWLNIGATALFGWLYWPYNPHLYRLSHQKFHHIYTLHQGSDGEDVPNYVELTPRLLVSLFLKVFSIRSLVQLFGRLFTLKPASKGWRGRGFRLDTWEQFVLEKASDRERNQVKRMSVAALVGHALFAGACIYLGIWFVPILVTLAPFYGAGFMGYMAGIHQHAACEPNDPDFRISCGDAILDPLSSFLYWRMEYHIEHHMFAAIPCYNLKKFSRFVADQLPPKEHAIPRIIKLHNICRQKYGSYQNWRDTLGLYKGF